jgi:hypothetical protein
LLDFSSFSPSGCSGFSRSLMDFHSWLMSSLMIKAQYRGCDPMHHRDSVLLCGLARITE